MIGYVSNYTGWVTVRTARSRVAALVRSPVHLISGIFPQKSQTRIAVLYSLMSSECNPAHRCVHGEDGIPNKWATRVHPPTVGPKRQECRACSILFIEANKTFLRTRSEGRSYALKGIRPEQHFTAFQRNHEGFESLYGKLKYWGYIIKSKWFFKMVINK